SPDELNPSPPQGYDYDLINAETFRKRAKAEDGRVMLPDGMSYRVFVLQNHSTISLELLNQLRDMVNQGMVLVGAKPLKTPGLSGYTNNDSEFNRIANELWGGIDGISVTANTVGSGKVFWGLPLQAILDKINVKPDFETSSLSGDAPITYIHRRIGTTEVYFIANQRRTSEELVCTFRVDGKQPELWDPNTGKTTAVPIYEITNGRVSVPVQLEPSGSVFIVFRSRASGNHIRTITKDSKTVLTTKAFPAVQQKLYRDVTNNFTISLWVKPEMDVMLSARDFSGNVALDAWTDYYAIYPPSGEKLYGQGHQTCGLTVGRNGVVIWTRGAGKPILTLAAPAKISGWSHVAVVYNEGAPAIYVNGKLIQQGKNSEAIMHPGIGKAWLSDGASYYNGDMSEPQLFTEALSEQRILQLAQNKILPKLYETPIAEILANGKTGVLLWEEGKYSFEDNKGKSSLVQVSGIDKPVELTGSWKINFPVNMGAPAQITLPKLISLHQHTEDGVKYFSGTAVYSKSFNVSANTLTDNKRLFLDLGQVEVIAEVSVNGKNLGILWKRPYKVDITEAVKTGVNVVEIKVTNLWPNRLIGDEQVPEMYKFPPPAPATGPFASLSGGGIIELPDWYKQGQPKPADGRVTFTTWKHYHKDSPLLESGLIGPVVLRTSVLKMV
ncbi:MAG TPA: glycosyl hydrolase, partial [Segetibacter sp.]